jgi:hypothetical protein
VPQSAVVIGALLALAGHAAASIAGVDRMRMAHLDG